MFPIPSKRFLPAVQQPGLNGLFGSFLRSLIAGAVEAVKALPFVGVPISNGVKKVIEGVAGQWVHFDNDGNLVRNRPVMQVGGAPAGTTPIEVTTGSGEPSAAEQSILTAWSQGKLNPYYKALCMQLSEAFANSNVAFQVDQINIVLFKIASMRRYFANYDKAGLTSVGLETRNDLIETILQPVEAMIYESMAKNAAIQKQSVVTTISNDNATLLQPLMPLMLIGETIQSFKYAIPAGTSATQVQTVVPVTTITTPNPTTSDENLFSGKNILLVLGIAVAIKSLFFSKK